MAEMIEIVPYDPKWPKIFEKEAKKILQALKGNLLAIHHFGSTAVCGLNAKPKVDILAVVKDLKNLDSDALGKIGFESRGEAIPSGRYFSKKGEMRIHLHVFEEGNPFIEQNLAFRDWLRTHKEDRKAYEKLKRELSALYTDGMSYCRAKTEFIQEIIKKSAKG